MPVRTKVLCHRDSLPVNAWTVLYTCPADRTAIVKHLVLANETGVSRTLAVAVRRAGVYARILPGGLLATGTTRELRDGYLAMHPADQLVVFNGGENASTATNVYAAGVELLGTAT